MTGLPAFTAYAIAEPELTKPASALMLFIINLIGIGLGPLSVGLISDALSPGIGSGEGLRWAMVATAAVGLIAGGTFGAARGPLRRDTVG